MHNNSFYKKNNKCPIKIGYGISYAHHGELFQGQIEDPFGNRKRCLVSLPCPNLISQVSFAPNYSGILHVEPPHKYKVKKAVEVTLDFIHKTEMGGLIKVSSNIEEGKGYGSSTADCVAAVRATIQAMQCSISESEVARLVVCSETASDNVMFDRSVLFAQREAVILEDYGKPFPEVQIIGADTNLQGYVDTLAYPPAEYQWHHIQMFKVLIAALRRAFFTDDINLLGRVATASAIINEEFLPKQLFREIQSLAERTQVLGISVAHTGTVVGFILDPADPCLEGKSELLERGLCDLGIKKVIRFNTSKQPNMEELNLSLRELLI